MHIAEGALTGSVITVSFAATAVFTAIGLKKLDYDKIPQASLLSASFFVATFLHLPIGIGSIHLVLNGIIGLLVGWASFPIILVSLLLQGVMFQMGGLTILGVNTLIMAVPAVVCFYLFKSSLNENSRLSSFFYMISSIFSKILLKLFKINVNKKTFAAALGPFSCGFCAVLLSSILSALALIYSGDKFVSTAYALMIANIPVMFADGIITSLCILFLKKVQPEMLSNGD